MAARPSRGTLVLAALLALSSIGAAGVAWLAGVWVHDEPVAGNAPDAAIVARGAYLAQAGNCAGCHTARGGAAWAGGRAIATPFGTVYASNLTPDAATGLGRWSADDFWRALHHGRSRDGRFLLPAFPYPQYTQVTRADADALWAYLRSLPAVQQANREHDLRWPYRGQVALAIWRALYFSPTPFMPDAQRSADWNRGAYLVRGLGHCAACHAERNALGATQQAQELGGGHIPMQGWYAPSLAAAEEAGVAAWSTDETVALLRDGRNARAAALGPMAEVVFRSTQFLHADDLRAMATYLRELPQHPVARPEVKPAPAADLTRGAKLFEEHCADCHGADGEGRADADAAYPKLRGRRSLSMNSPANLIKVVLGGGFAPATAGNPRPYGMPPFAARLSDEEVAALLSHLRLRFGNAAAPVTPLQVQQLR